LWIDLGLTLIQTDQTGFRIRLDGAENCRSLKI